MNAATHARLAAGGAFLVAVVWIDLMFDVQAFGSVTGAPLPEPVLASIANYYRRITTGASLMHPLIGLTMLAVVIGAARNLRPGPELAVRRFAFACCAAPISLAGLRVFPNAQQLGRRLDSLDVQSGLARTIAVDHVLCWLAIATFTLVELRLAGAASRAATAPPHARVD
jgi:hypothetical protein